MIDNLFLSGTMTAVRFKIRFQYVLLLCLPTILFCLSCAGFKKPPRPEPSEMVWDTKTAEQVLAFLRHEQERITDLTAAFSLNVDPPNPGQPSNLRGVLFFSKTGEVTRFRIKCLGPFGRVLFDLLQKGNDLQLYIPSRKTLYAGKTDATAQPRNVWHNMLKTMFADYSEMEIAKNGGLTFNNDQVIIPLLHGKIVIDPNTGLVSERHDREHVIFYDRYEQGTGFPPVPTHIRVKTTDSTRHALCRLSQVRVNTRLSHVFDFSAYKPEKFLDLKALNMKTGD